MKLATSAGSIAGLLGVGGATALALPLSSGVPVDSNNLSFGNNASLKTFKGGVCVNKFLTKEQREALDQAKIDKNQWSTGDNGTTKFFSNSAGTKSKGCLAISWDKQTWKDGHWKGTIRYEWIFTKEDETMVVHGFFNSEDDETSSDTGEDVNANWKAIYVKGQIKVGTMLRMWLGTNLAAVVPQNPTFDFKGWTEEYWGFNPVYDKRCKDGHCQGTPETTKHFESIWKWTSSTDGKNLFTDWTKNYLTIFDNVSGFPNKTMSALAKDKGTWETLEVK